MAGMMCIEPAGYPFWRSADHPRHRDSGATSAASRDGPLALGATGGTGKRTSGSAGGKRLSSSNPLVRKRMQLVEKWQRSREKDEESEEEVSSNVFPT